MATLALSPSKLGLHYFPDALHYRQTDLRAWLPELRSLGVSWLIMLAPKDRAIPEDFICGLIKEGIEPVLHFDLPLDPAPKIEEMAPLLEAYSRWGVRYVAFFDRPNSRQAWRYTAWAQTDLVERFLDCYTPLAEMAIEMKMHPIFPPLEPGGDYWDIAFLRAVLQTMHKRNKLTVMENMILGVYAAAGERPLEWGAGGPERWAGARPYYTPPEEQDQRGFHIFDWYRAITQAVLGSALPMMLFGAGSPGLTFDYFAAAHQDAGKVNFHASRTITLARLAAGKPQSPFTTSLAEDIVACNFWLLSAGEDSLYAGEAWYHPNGQTAPVVGVLRQATATGQEILHEQQEAIPAPVNAVEAAVLPPLTMAEEVTFDEALPFQKAIFPESRHPIAHYLLLPVNQDGNLDIQLEGIYPFIKKHNITVGFSLEEAALAAQVTVLETKDKVSAHLIEQLRSTGSRVVCLSGTGMELATFLTGLLRVILELRRRGIFYEYDFNCKRVFV